MKFSEQYNAIKSNDPFWSIYFKISMPSEDEPAPEESTRIQAKTREEAIKKFYSEFLDSVFDKAHAEIIDVEKN